MQWNCCGITNKKSDILSVSKDYDILLLCETFLKPNKLFSLNPNFNLVRADRLNFNKGGLAIAIKKNINFTRISTILNIENNLETLSISIDTSVGKLLIINVYRVPSDGKKVSENTWNRFFQSAFAENPYRIFIGGDFNSHNYLWGSSRSCQNGEALYSSLENTDLICLNNGKTTFVSRPNDSQSILDLTFVSSQLFICSSQDVWDDSMGSDHYPVITKLDVQIPISKFYSHKYNLKKTDWHLFSTNLKNSLNSRAEDISPSTDPITSYNTFVQCVDHAVLSASPKGSQSNLIGSNKGKSKSKQFIPAPWWNEDCDKAIQDRREASIKFRKTSNYVNYLEYKKCEAKAKRTLNESRRKSFRNFCNSLNRNTSISKVWRVIRSFKNRFSQPVTASCSADTETIKKLQELTIEMCPPTTFHDSFPENFNSNNFLEAPFNISEFNMAISSLKLKSSPGLDKINNKIILELPTESRLVLLDIFNNILSSGTFPSSWNNFLIFFIPKSAPGKFRPIALASCMLKLMEKLIFNRLSWFLEHHLHLSPSQFGFRKSKSCADNLAIISTEIFTGFTQGEVTAGLFLDLKGAFPSVVPQILTKDLKDLGIPKHIAKFIYNAVACKNMYFNINGELTDPRISTVGLPQGCILSPILYSIYTRKLYSLLPPECTLVEFADDIAILARSRDPLHCIRVLQNCLNIFSRFLFDRGLEICPDKTKLILFNRLKINLEDPNYCLSIGDAHIFPSIEVKFLGIILDYKLTFDSHFKFLIEKLSKLLNIIKVLRGIWWGAHPFILLTIYRALIRSCMEYGSHIFNFKNHTLFSKLEKIRNQAIRLALGYRMSTPINVMLAEACDPPLKFRFDFLAKKYIIKILSNSNHPLISKIQNLLEITSQRNTFGILNTFTLLIAYRRAKEFSHLINKSFRYSYYDFPYSDHIFEPQIVTDIGFSIQNSVNPPLLFKDILDNNFRNYTCFYTDGSKSENGNKAGCASVCPSEQLTQSLKVNAYASIFTIEAFAILITLDYVRENNLKKVVIFSDSLSVLKSISCPNPNNIKSHIIFLIRNRLASLTLLHFDIILAWIPGHKGLEGNEIADEAAKLASSNSPLLNFGLPPSDFVSCFREQLNDKCHDYFTTRGRYFGNFYTERFYKPRTKPWFATFYAERQKIVSICRMRSNHHSLKESLFRKNIVNSPACPCNPEINEDLEHVLWNCSRYDNFRPKLIRRLSKTFKCIAPFCSDMFLSNPSPTIISHIFDFLKETNLSI